MTDPARPQRPLHPSLQPMTPWSVEASREIFEEMSRPPADTPERRATFERARVMAEVVKRMEREAGEAK